MSSAGRRSAALRRKGGRPRRQDGYDASAWRADERGGGLSTPLRDPSASPAQMEAEFMGFSTGCLDRSQSGVLLTCDNGWNLLLLKLVWPRLGLQKISNLLADGTKVPLNPSPAGMGLCHL